MRGKLVGETGQVEVTPSSTPTSSINFPRFTKLYPESIRTRQSC